MTAGHRNINRYTHFKSSNNNSVVDT
jgi:hypothetical protein